MSKEKWLRRIKFWNNYQTSILKGGKWKLRRRNKKVKMLKKIQHKNIRGWSEAMQVLGAMWAACGGYTGE